MALNIAGMTIAAGFELFVTLVAIFELVVFIPIILTLLIGVAFYLSGRKTREQVADAAIQTPEGETAPGVVIA